MGNLTFFDAADRGMLWNYDRDWIPNNFWENDSIESMASYPSVSSLVVFKFSLLLLVRLDSLFFADSLMNHNPLIDRIDIFSKLHPIHQYTASELEELMCLGAEMIRSRQPLEHSKSHKYG
jgi:hypothetical protein